MESHTCDNQKTEKFLAFQQGQIMTLAAASVIMSVISGHAVAFIYTINCYNFVLFCVYMCKGFAVKFYYTIYYIIYF